MADEADHATALQQAEIDALVARHRAKVAGHGRKSCEHCDEPISDLRRRDGARLCLSCQIEAERALRGLPARKPTP
jgi:RNA polymerase-binding transcription factor DksA